MANALGKGLGALLSEQKIDDDFNFGADGTSKSFASGVNGITEISLDSLKPNPYQMRKEFSQEELAELAESIKEHGVIEPIIVTENPAGGYFIVGGERRTRASRLAGLEKIPAVIKTYSPEQMLETALIENIQREDLNSVEEAMAYRQLMEMGNLNQDEVAKRVGKNRSTVANSLRLLKLPEDMQHSLADGKISAGHARAILSVLNPSDQMILYARILGSGMSVRDAEQMASELNGGGRASVKTKKADKKKERDPDIILFEEKLIEKFGTKVQIKGNLDKGTIQIDYFSSEDLDRLYSLLAEE